MIFPFYLINSIFMSQKELKRKIANIDIQPTYFWIQLPVSLESSNQHMRSCNLYVVALESTTTKQCQT